MSRYRYDNEGWTALNWAAFNGKLDSVKCIADKMEENIDNLDSGGFSALYN